MYFIYIALALTFILHGILILSYTFYLKVMVSELKSYFDSLLDTMLKTKKSSSTKVSGNWVAMNVVSPLHKEGEPLSKIRYMCPICGRYEDFPEPYCNCGAKLGHTS